MLSIVLSSDLTNLTSAITARPDSSWAPVASSRSFLRPAFFALANVLGEAGCILRQGWHDKDAEEKGDEK